MTPLMKQIRVYDNGGKSFDRYTVVYMFEPESRGCYGARGMSKHPFSPQGFGCYTSAMPGRHLGKRIRLIDLPKDCIRLILQDLNEVKGP